MAFILKLLLALISLSAGILPAESCIVQADGSGISCSQNISLDSDGVFRTVCSETGNTFRSCKTCNGIQPSIGTDACISRQYPAYTYENRMNMTRRKTTVMYCRILI